MSDKILVLRINLWFIIRKLEEISYDFVDYEVEAKIKEINEKVYELSGAIEELEVLLE
ncbi:MAG TPA: hypothetical protein PKE38_07170 [Ignavibacteriaceae bacterium]|nr:hypothetical protein [Ignavibacteriaceae bacterium]